jgi:hypothetical protein
MTTDEGTSGVVAPGREDSLSLQSMVCAHLHSTVASVVFSPFLWLLLTAGWIPIPGWAQCHLTWAIGTDVLDC